MKILVTGAGGFVGRYVVAAALGRGHAVRAMVRPAAKAGSEGAEMAFAHNPRCEVVRADLRDGRSLDAAVAGVDAVVHLAAVKSGDLYAQLGGTVVGTENLLNAMKRCGVRRIAAVSSFSVYEYLRRWSHGLLDERSPLAQRTRERDAYCQTKLWQERLIRERQERDGLAFTILRPGVIFGKDNLWTARLGMDVSPRLWLRTGAYARLPVTYVENCAHAVVLAVESEDAVGQTFNVVDDELPTQRRYARLLRERMAVRPRVVVVPWPVMRLVARCMWAVNRAVFHGGAKVPSMFVPASLHARAKPLRYGNGFIKEVLGWRPRYGLAAALDRATGREEGQLLRERMGRVQDAEVVR